MECASDFTSYHAPTRLEETPVMCPGPFNVALQATVGLRSFQGAPLLTL